MSLHPRAVIPFFCVETTTRVPPGRCYAGSLFSRFSATHAFIGGGMRCLVVGVGLVAPRAASPRRYPSWTAYYNDVSISTRAIALPRLCNSLRVNCANVAPRAQLLTLADRRPISLVFFVKSFGTTIRRRNKQRRRVFCLLNERKRKKKRKRKAVN